MGRLDKSSYIAMMSYYAGKTVWITGASAGLGKAMAVELSRRGAGLILSARNVERLEAVRRLCDGPGSVHILPLDMEDGAAMDRTIDGYRDLVEEVDILINNAGISQRSLTKDTDYAVYQKLINVNYLGTVRLSLHLLKVFRKKRSGHFVVISSMAGKFGVPHRSGYSAAKMALHGFFESLRAESDPAELAVTMVCPAFVRTNVSINALTGSGGAQGEMEEAMEGGMSPEEFTKIVLSAIQKEKEEVLIGGFKETKLANFVNRCFPSLFRKMIRKSKVK